MANENQTPKKFRPERPIVLNEETTGFKTKDEVLTAIEQLRGEGWLCTYGEKTRPLHMSFNDEKEFAEFKKTAAKLNVKLISKVYKADDLDEMEHADANIPPEATAKSTYQDPSGKVHIGS